MVLVLGEKSWFNILKDKWKDHKKRLLAAEINGCIHFLIIRYQLVSSQQFTPTTNEQKYVCTQTFEVEPKKHGHLIDGPCFLDSLCM